MIDEILVHHIDTARFLFGDVSSVYGETRRINPVIHGGGDAILTLRHINETTGLIIPIWVRLWMRQSSRASAPGEIWSGREKMWTDDFCGAIAGIVCAALSHFISCLESSLRFESEAGEYLDRTFAVVEGAYSSAASNCRVEVLEMVAGKAMNAF
jgi:hypothetical protein